MYLFTTSRHNVDNVLSKVPRLLQIHLRRPNMHGTSREKYCIPLAADGGRFTPLLYAAVGALVGDSFPPAVDWPVVAIDSNPLSTLPPANPFPSGHIIHEIMRGSVLNGAGRILPWNPFQSPEPPTMTSG